MANRIRRNSMEHLQIYDLDKFIFDQTSPPPLPPPRQHRNRLPPDYALERYHFLCDRNRHQTDPIYAATPMFTTIPQKKQPTYHRQLLGSRIPLDLIKPKLVPPTSPESAEPESARTEINDDETDEDDNEESDDSNDDSDAGADESDSSSSSDDPNEDYFDDDDDQKGLVEQIFNRHKQ